MNETELAHYIINVLDSVKDRFNERPDDEEYEKISVRYQELRVKMGFTEASSVARVEFVERALGKLKENHPKTLVGLSEIAEISGVTTSAVANWRSRHVDFPKPIAVLAAGPVFDGARVVHWLEHKGKKVCPT